MTIAGPADGSSLYYTLWGLDSDAQQRALARLQLGAALQSATDEVREPDVARRKIHWWHEELQRLHDGNPRHPAAVACADLAGSGDALQHGLAVLGAAAEDRLDPAATEAQLDQRLNRSAGARAWLVLLGTATDPSLDDGLRDVANGLARHERLARLGELLTREHPVFALEHYRSLSARPADIGAAEPEAAARGTHLIQGAIAAARARIATGLIALEPAIARGEPARGLIVLGRLRDAQLALWQRAAPDLVRQRPSLTPLRKLYIAWRRR